MTQLRAAIYARYSSDNQRDASIEDQVRQCRAHIDREKWLLGQVYSDHAISGATALRPGYQKMLEDGRAGHFDILVAEALDRLSRDQENIAGLFKQLSFAGVRLVTLSEGEINELHVGLKGTMNALFIKYLAAKIGRGQQGRISRGFSAGGLSYGYEVIRKISESGELLRGERRIKNDEARIIVKIFRNYVGGKSPRQIAGELNAGGIPSPRGGEWNASTINGHRARRNGILNNEAYRGILVYNRVRMVKDPKTGKQISRVNPPDEWQRIEAPHLKIVADDLWDRAQQLKSRYAGQPPQRARRPKRLFSGLLKCSVCGGSLTITRPGKYGCSTHREKGTCDNSRQIAVDRLEQQLLKGVVDKLSDPIFQSAFIEESNRELSRLDSMISDTALRKESRVLEQKIKRIVAAIADGTDTPAMRRALHEFEARKSVAEAELRSTYHTQPRLTPKKLRAIFEEKVKNLEKALYADVKTLSNASLILRKMIERIVVEPGEGRGRASIEVYGDPASAFLFGQGETAQNRMITVVAEEGLEPRHADYD